MQQASQKGMGPTLFQKKKKKKGMRPTSNYQAKMNLFCQINQDMVSFTKITM